MTSTSRLLETLLERVPDEPRNIDFRGLLLESPDLFGDADGAVALRRDRRLLAVFGRPRAEVLDAARAAARRDAEIVAPLEARQWLESVLGVDAERGLLHAVGEGGLRRRRGLPEAVLLDREAPLDHLPQPLREEIEGVLGERPVVSVLEGGRPVAICHPTLTTERYWDVSIETLPAYRRGGRAMAAFLRLEEEMRRGGRRPVWGAVESNAASLDLAEALGFVPVGEIAVFE